MRLPGSWRALTEGSLFSRARGALGSCIVLHMISFALLFVFTRLRRPAFRLLLHRPMSALPERLLCPRRRECDVHTVPRRRFLPRSKRATPAHGLLASPTLLQ